MSQEKERLLARKARIESRLAAIEETEAKKREKEDQRRAELAGQAVLKRARKDHAFAAQLRQVLDAEIRGQRDRAVFDLPAKSRGDAQAGPAESGAPSDEAASVQTETISRPVSSS